MKRHPVYVVRRSDFEGCGHQHQTSNAAHNCAIGILTRHKKLEWCEVFRIRLMARSFDIKQISVERIEQWFGKDNAQVEN